MIQMTRGTYGLKDGRTVRAMTKHSPPFSLPLAREAELIALGVAVKVEAPTPAERKSMKELRAVAADRGVDVSGARTRGDILAALAAAADGDDDKRASGLLDEEG